MNKHVRLLTFCCLFLIVISFVIPVSAEVKSLKTDKPLYKKNIDRTIVFSGTAEDENINEIVTIVINDPSDNFVLLRQGYIGLEKTFEVKIPEKDLAKFTLHGIYNATAFIVNKTEGISITFDFSLDGSPVIHPTPIVETETTETTPPISDVSDEESETVVNDDSSSNSEEKSIQEKIQERIDAAKKQKELQASLPILEENQTASEVDSSTNSSIVEHAEEINLGSNLLYIIAGVGGAGAAGAAVYVMRNTNRHRPDYASYFTQPEKTESIQKPTMQNEDDYALMILKNRLAKGEITVDEFNELKRALKEP